MGKRPAMTFRIDRRPVACLNTFGALYDQSPVGQPKWFYEEGGVQEYIDRLVQPAYEMGFRRTLHWLPVGSNRQRLMASAHWEPMPEYRKKEWHEIMRPWLTAHPDLDYGIYGGFMIHDASTLRMPENNPDPNDNVRIPNLNNEKNREWFRRTWGPWIQIGVRWGMLDWATHGENRLAMARLSNQFDAFGIKLGGESFPSDQNPDTRKWELSPYIYRCPWLALHRHLAIRDSNQEWNVDPERTELHVVLSNHDRDAYPIDSHVIDSYLERGFIVSSMLGNDDPMTRYAMMKQIKSSGSGGGIEV